MRTLVTLMLIALVAAQDQDASDSGPQIDPFPSFYHTTEDLKIQLYELSRSCQGMKLSRVSLTPDIDMITFNENADKPHKAFVLFGEHAREMISTETGVHMVKQLCSDTQNADIQAIRDQYELRMIVNVNPISRSKVEAGQYCLRENENGVDLNRNYKAHWNENHDERLKHVAPGPFAFSEKETQVVRDQLQHYKPTVFFSIHSGTLGLYAPYAWSDELAQGNLENSMTVLNEIHEKHCPSCKVGSCGKQVGYLAPGTSMDYVYDDLNVKYSFTFEIYNQKVDLSKPPNDSFLQVQDTDKNSNLNKQQQMEEILRTHSCFSEIVVEMTANECLNFFNPTNEQQFDYYVDNWTKAIVTGLNRVAQLETPAQQ